MWPFDLRPPQKVHCRTPKHNPSARRLRLAPLGPAFLPLVSKNSIKRSYLRTYSCQSRRCRSSCRFHVLRLAGPMSQSQSLFRSYGSILPTSLTYIRLDPEAVHLGDLMRSSVRTVTGVLCRSLGFSRSVRLPRDPAESTGLWRFRDAFVSLPPRGAILGICEASTRTDNSASRTTIGFPKLRRFAARDLTDARHIDVPFSELVREGDP